MQKSIQEQIDERLIAISDALGVEVQFVDVSEGAGVVRPAFNLNAIISKMVALFVFTGTQVPAEFSPAYNRVHADVDWWKKTLVEPSTEAPPPSAPDTPPTEPAA